MNKIKKWRQNKHKALLIDVLLIVAIMLSIAWWQNRGSLVAEGQAAPVFELTALDDSVYKLEDYQGKQVLLYFFAPWCSVCKLSADNLNDLRAARSEDDLMIMMMALSYESREEVDQFVTDLDLKVPVLLGAKAQMMDYQIQGFPTYYVIDEKGHLSSKSMGYSTEIGMRLRTW